MARGTAGLRPPLTDAQANTPGCMCKGCRGEMYAGEALYVWEGVPVCSDCFKEKVSAWINEATAEAAQVLGVERQTV